MLSSFIILWGMVLYPLSIKILGKLFKGRKNSKNYSNTPTVTVMVVAHNEETVIKEKLSNLLNLDYPKNKMEILVSSDNSNDRTNDFVKTFQKEHPFENIRLFEVKKRKGKTNAQNEAQKTIDSEFIVFTDANSMLHSQAVKELMASFTTRDICYVTGRLSILNFDKGEVSGNESKYWSKDLKIREIESRIHTITAGNGALYACRNEDYVDFDPIKSHDGHMPKYFAFKGSRAIANHDAIAYEKAGEVIEDEFKRKVRMNRGILKNIIPDIRLFNVVRNGWFSYFYFGHRTCRYSLWLAHFTLLLSNVYLVTDSWFYFVTLVGQVFFYLIALLKITFKIDNKYISMIYYYCVTLAAQWVGVYNMLTGKAKPFWEKAESTR
ncbi:glycosyl transferase [Salimicrobium jeotgali]|nr:glycosyl transferase [Salimicrobium jeotgali]